MWRRTVMLSLTGVLVLGILGLGQALAQESPDRRRGPRDPEEMRQRIEQFRQQMSDRMREQLGATVDEWKILQPRIEKVQQLQRQSRGGFRGMLGFDRGLGGRGGPPDRRREGEAERERSDIEKKSEALRSLLEDESASADSIKAALDALRKARANAQKELAAARKELREVVTSKQEAQFVLIGILD